MAKGFGHRMMVYMSRRMIACDEASFLVSLREERKLSLREWMQLNMHLLSCHLCRKYARQIGEMQKTMEKYREGCDPESCSHKLPHEAGVRLSKELDSGLNAK
jgi:hypothetical protein